MFEVLKTLIEKPENIRSHIIIFFKILLAAIIASKLYEYFYGRYTPILIGDKSYWKDMYDFFIGGRVFIVMMFFFFVKFIVFDFFTTILYQLLNKFIRSSKLGRTPKEYNNTIRLLLKYAGILKFDKKENGYPTPDRNFNIALKILEEEKKEDIEDVILELKHSTVFEIFNLYFVFSLVYFLILREFHLTIISVTLIIGFIFFFAQLYFIEFMFYFLEKTFDDFIRSLRMINQLHTTNTFLKKYHFLSNEELQNNIEHNSIDFNINGSFYNIVHYDNHPKSINKIKKLDTKNDKNKILLIIDEINKNQLLDYIEIDSIQAIRFSESAELITKLENAFFSDFFKEKEI